MSEAGEIRLPDVEPERMRAAVRAVLLRQRATMPSASLTEQELIGRLPSQRRLKEGAVQSSKGESEDAGAAEYFQSLLELGYLVASADGLHEREREALALLVESVTEAAVDREALKLHLSDLDDTCDWLGRPERLGRVAANFEELVSREEAFSFAALVAMADGSLNAAEMQVLKKLGEYFAFSPRAVREMAERVAQNIRHELQA